MTSEPTLEFPTGQHWRAWLDQNHGTSSGVWLHLAKKESEAKTVSYAEALEEALCVGWIDGQRRRSSRDGFWLQRFCPRGRRSIWSKVNRAKALALIDTGRMAPAGLAAVAKAQENGEWDVAYDSPAKAAIPEDLRVALEANKQAAEMFTKLTSQNRYAILFRLQQTRKPEARARKLAQFIDMLVRGETLHPQKKRLNED